MFKIGDIVYFPGAEQACNRVRPYKITYNTDYYTVRPQNDDAGGYKVTFTMAKNLQMTLIPPGLAKNG